jgi:hypothetical protein
MEDNSCSKKHIHWSKPHNWNDPTQRGETDYFDGNNLHLDYWWLDFENSCGLDIGILGPKEAGKVEYCELVGYTGTGTGTGAENLVNHTEQMTGDLDHN